MSEQLPQRWIADDLSYMAEMRQQFILDNYLAFSRPRMVTKRWGDHHARMCEHWIKQAHACARPGYTEARGFVPKRLDPYRIGGCEKPYGYGTHTYWHYVWLAAKSAWLSGWHDAIGSTYETPADSDRRRFAIVTGVTS